MKEIKYDKTTSIDAICVIVKDILSSNDITITLDEEIRRDDKGNIIGIWKGISLSATKSFDAETGKE